MLNEQEYNCILCSFVVSDDEAVGVGGILLRYIYEGHNIIKVIFSSGEMSHPHFRKEVIIKDRIVETVRVSKKFGIKKTIFLELKDSKLKEDINKKVRKSVKYIIRRYKPSIIFIPSEYDPHSDHKAVYNSVLYILQKIKYKKSLYSYEVWNVGKEEKPAVYIDVTNYFKKKIKMMKSFKSQWLYMYILLLPVYLRSRYYGLKIGSKYAERIYKLK